MKKIIALVAAAVLSASAVFAENTLHLGGTFPLHWAGDDVFSAGAGGALDYTHVADGGFTWKLGLDFAFSSTDDIKNGYTDDDFSGVDMMFGVGFGWSFIHDEKMTLSVTGNFGVGFWSVAQEVEFTIADYSTGVSQEFDVGNVYFYIGPEVDFTYRFTKHFGVFADLGIFYGIGGESDTIHVKTKHNGETIDNDKFTYHDDYDISGLIIRPKIGVAFTF